MAKTNFTKAEEALAGALQKLSVEQLLEQTSSTNKEKRSVILKLLQLELRKLQKHDAEFYKNLNFKNKELESYLAEPEKIKDEDWKKIVELKQKVEQKVKEIDSKSNNEDIVNAERHKHINKRFNVNEKWLPLK